jgi:dephospho-CoA kinase
MFLIGLTGGIAAGKSTVAEIWVSLGAVEIDADVLAREAVIEGSPGLEQVRRAFGENVFDESGSLDRKALGELIFNDAEQRKILDGIVHPLVRQRAQSILSSLPQDSMVVYTVPLLVEASVQFPFDAVVSVEAPETVRAQRLVKSRGLNLEQANARIYTQASAADRAARADYILDSDQDLVGLVTDATKLFEALSDQSKRIQE